MQKNEELIKYVKNCYKKGKVVPAPDGEGTIFIDSGRQLALALGRNSHIIRGIEESGKATAQVLIDLADLMGDDVIKVLILGKVLRPEHDKENLTEMENDLLTNFRKLSSVTDSRTVLRVIQGLLDSDDDPVEAPLLPRKAPSESGK